MTDIPNGNTLAYRVGRVEQDITTLFDRKAETKDVDGIAGQLRKLDDEKADNSRVEELRKDMQSVRNALYAVAGSIIVGAVLFALALTQGAGS